MSLVNNHVLFPFAAQWQTKPEFLRTWQTEISSSVLGNEQRRALRSVPRRSLSFELVNLSAVELGELNDAILAAKKSGLACVPFHGRAQTHAVAGEDNLLQLVETGWTWRAGDFAFLRAPDDSFEVAEIESVELDMDVRQLTLVDPLDNTYAAGSLCWPMIFGKFSTDAQFIRTPRVGPTRITIQELVSPAAVQLGEIEAVGGAGIGVMEIGSTFVIA